jgi:hypothetical protein
LLLTLNNANSRIIYNYNKNEIKLRPDAKTIDNLDLPDGLKEQLVSHGLTIKQLMCMKASDLAEELGIDLDVVRLIIHAIR